MIFSLAMVALVLVTAGPGRVHAQTPAPVDTSGWTTLREPALGFELRHPPDWRVGRATGTLESVLLSEPSTTAVRVTLQLHVQRGINPKGLPIEEWYADQMKRLRVGSPPPTSRVTLGGRPAIRRAIARPDGTRLDYYVAFGSTDVFQASVTPPPAGAAPTHEAILATLTFLK
jgi:hypothetical protein